VEILVNNAGVGSSVPFGQPGPAALADAERQLDLNVRAVLRLCHAALTPMTARRRGLILNVSSTAGFVPRGGASTYAASKAWVTSFTESLALQAAPDGVRVCAVCPGFVRTEFHERAGIDVSRLPAWLWLDADAVARAGLDDALRGRIVSVPDVRYKALVAGALAVPRPALRRIMRQSGRIVGPR
jgi:short-subunit dehydrogenase